MKPAKLSAVALAAVMAAVTLGACGSGDSASTAGAGAAECTPRHQFSTVSEGELTVALAPYEPAAYTDSSGNLVGIEGELLRQIAEWECLEIKVLPLGSYAATIPAVQSGRADITVGDIYRTAERAAVTTLTDPIYKDALEIVSKGGTVTSIQQLVSDNLRLGGSTGGLWDDDFQKLLGDNFKLYQTFQDAVQDLQAGRLDAVVMSSLGYNALTAGVSGVAGVMPPADSRVTASTAPGQATWPTNNSNPELTTALNADISELRSSGAITEALEKYDLDPELADPGEPNLL